VIPGNGDGLVPVEAEPPRAGAGLDDADPPGGEARQRRLSPRGGQAGAGEGENLEPGRGPARQAVSASGEPRGDEQSRRAAFLRRENEAARGGQVIGFLEGPDFRHRGRQSAAFYGLLEAPQAFPHIARMDEDEAGRIEAMEAKPRPIGHAPFPSHAVLEDPDDRAGAPWSGMRKSGNRSSGAIKSTRIAQAYRPIPLRTLESITFMTSMSIYRNIEIESGSIRSDVIVIYGEAGRERRGEARGRHRIAGASRHDLVQGAAGEAAVERAIEAAAFAEADTGVLVAGYRNAGGAAVPLDRGDPGAQKIDPTRGAALRHRFAPLSCSLFVLMDSSFRTTSQGGIG
jgi:hypothetical protein